MLEKHPALHELHFSQTELLCKNKVLLPQVENSIYIKLGGILILNFKQGQQAQRNINKMRVKPITLIYGSLRTEILTVCRVG